MNNRTLWQLTASGVADLHDINEELRVLQTEIRRYHQQKLILEDRQNRLRSHQDNIDQLATKIFQRASLESNRVIISHNFELSLEDSEEDSYKVYTVR